MIKPLALAGILCAVLQPALAQKVGEVDTAFKLLGPDHKIVIDAYDDPKVKGVA